VSISFSFFFTFGELFFCSTLVKKDDIHSHSANYQNIVTLIVMVKDERGALSSW